MRVISGRIGPAVNITVSLLIAMGLSMIVRPVTAELTRTLGTVWPFSTVHCETRAAPGCERATPMRVAAAGYPRR